MPVGASGLVRVYVLPIGEAAKAILYLLLYEARPVRQVTSVAILGEVPHAAPSPKGPIVGPALPSHAAQTNGSARFTSHANGHCA